MDQQTKPLRLLALDGGGVRGYSELVILEQLMLGIQKHQKLPSPPKPCEIFDMICGTSTGGIIALMLGRLKMSINDTRDVYGEVCKDVFGKPKNGKITEGRYSAKDMAKILKAAIEKYGQDPELKLIPESNAATECKVFVCCQNARALNSPRLFQSYQSFSAGQYLDLKIWEAARATSAAPTFFKRMKIGPPGAQEEFVDGGIGNNNPIRLLMQETPKAFDNQRAVAFLISIGTGITNIMEFKEPGFFQKAIPTKLISALKDIATDCERIEKEVAQRFATKPGIYFRFNVEHGLEHIPMERYDELGNIKSRTINYLQDGKIAHSIDEAVLALCSPSDRIKASELWHSFPSSRKTLLDTQLVEDQNARKVVMTNLDYKGRHDREDQIWEVQAHPQTVEWIWSSSFAGWASGGDKLFWICGKPGSGKSVIMESITKSDDLKDYLRRGLNKQWTVLYHFFFDFGVSGDIRNNFEGFLRSLLYQLIQKFGSMQEETQSGIKEKKQWSKRELQEKLGKVLEQRSDPICILLDGLDEYQDDKWDLVKFIQETAKPHIKLCVASRPDLVFDTAFQGVQQIKMQDQNKPAIKMMVDHTLQESMGGSEFYSDDEYVNFIEEISEKADGVFLWARFAVKELRAAWIRGEYLEKLHERLEKIPEALEDIYARILGRIEPDEKQLAASMLQLVCYAKRLLTVPELLYALTQIDDEGDFPATRIQAPPGRYLPSKHMEKKVLALTGGLLEIFRGDSDSMEMSQFDDSDTSEHESLEHDYINIIHRTVRTYLERGGWERILGMAHEGALHAEMLWLRVCARSFPPSFVDLPPDTKIYKIPKRMKDDILALQKLDNKHLTLPGSATSLRDYAALSMLDHARRVENDLGVSSYAVLNPVLTDIFVCHHQDLACQSQQLCACFTGCPDPTHPLHLAIAHGLDRFVGDFLFHFAETTSRDSPEWNNVFYLEEAPHGEFELFSYVMIGHRISLLEFALRHASKPYGRNISQVRIVNTLLERYSRIQDAQMIFALRVATPELVQLLLRYWPDWEIPMDEEYTKHDTESEDEFWNLKMAENYQPKGPIRPLWHIARRRGHKVKHSEEILDIFLKRGEDINGQCGPVGTALHSNLLQILSYGSFRMCKLLLDKGADVNAHGPLGKPLEFAWRLAHIRWRGPKSAFCSTRMMKELIDRGAINQRPDPNGSVPSRKQMLDFDSTNKWDFEAHRRYYRGEGNQDKTASAN